MAELLALLLWAVAFGCKEDAILLPAYALALELTVLHVAAKAYAVHRANPTLARAFGISDMTVRPERLAGRDCRKDAGPCSTIQPGRW